MDGDPPIGAVAGIFHADGSPVDPDQLLSMRESAAYRGPDGAGLWSDGPVGLAHRLLRATEEFEREGQPCADGRGVWLTSDCRIDNREELAACFEAKGVWASGRSGPAPDAEYILGAYRLWGEECPGHLLGDFAFALWDGPRRKLFCARDPIGVKPFYFHWDGRRFLFGSEIKQILQVPGVPSALNLPHMADLLALTYPNRHETLYRHIEKLPPASCLTVEGGRLKVKRYWDWDPDSEPLSRRTQEENAEIFLGLLKESVRARLRVAPGFRSGAFLSGGLDSSSLAAVAASMAGPSFPVFTLCYPEAKASYRIPRCEPEDERFYSDQVIRRWDLEPHRLEVKGLSPLPDPKKDPGFQEGLPFHITTAYTQRLLKQAADSRVRVLLDGEGGDELFIPGCHVLLAESRKGNFLSFLKIWNGYRGKGESSWPQLARMIASSCVPEEVRAFRRRFSPSPIPAWFQPDFAKKADLLERFKKDFRWGGSLQVSGAYGVHVWIHSGFVSLLLQSAGQSAASAGVEVRYPFVDVRLLRFAASLPREQKLLGRTRKVLLREALKDFLPPAVRERPGKSEYSPAVRTYLELYAGAAFRDMFRDPHPVLASILRMEKVEKLYESWFVQTPSVRKIHGTLPVRQLWLMMGLDQWLKKKETLNGQETEAGLRGAGIIGKNVPTLCSPSPDPIWKSGAFNHNDNRRG